MKRLEVAELKDNLGEVLAEVEQGEAVAVARNGRVVARLVPVRRVPARRRLRTQREIDEIIAEMDRVAADLGSRWPKGVSVEDAINDVRS